MVLYFIHDQLTHQQKNQQEIVDLDHLMQENYHQQIFFFFLHDSLFHVTMILNWIHNFQNLSIFFKSMLSVLLLVTILHLIYLFQMFLNILFNLSFQMVVLRILIFFVILSTLIIFCFLQLNNPFHPVNPCLHHLPNFLHHLYLLVAIHILHCFSLNFLIIFWS